MSYFVPQLDKLLIAFARVLTAFTFVSSMTFWAVPLLAQSPQKQTEGSNASESEAKESMDVLNLAQQTYFSELKRFATKIPDMGLEIDAQTKHYLYEVVPQKQSNRSVMMTATARRSGLKSYTGAVFVLETDGVRLTVAGICATDQPSLTPPIMPMFPKSLSELVQCPPGSSLVE